MTPLIISLWMAAMCLECRAQKDNVVQPKGEETVTEGEAVTLDCQYNTTATDLNLFWYKQGETNSPKFILSRDSFGQEQTEEEFKERFSSTLNSNLRSVPLKIQKLQLSDSTVYYCALRLDAFVFGDGIRLNVLPKDLSPVAPTLFALSPLQPEEPSPRHDNDVCLAANFHPKEGEMVLNAKGGRVNMSTSGAVLSYKQKTFFYVGFLNRTIYSCELHNTWTNNDNAEPCADLHPENSLQNLLLLQMNMLRVMFTKTVALSTIITIRALLI